MTAAQVLPSLTDQIVEAPQRLKRAPALLGLLLLLIAAAAAQPATPEHPIDPQARRIDGVVNSTVFGMGQSIRITGTVKEGAISFGGDRSEEHTSELQSPYVIS